MRRTALHASDLSPEPVIRGEEATRMLTRASNYNALLGAGS